MEKSTHTAAIPRYFPKPTDISNSEPALVGQHGNVAHGTFKVFFFLPNYSSFKAPV